MEKTNTNKPPAFYVPREMSPATIPKGQRQLAAFLLNLIHWKWVCWQADDAGYVRLKAEYVTKIIPPTVWPALRTRLEAMGIIEVDNHYVHGGRRPQAMGYRVTPGYHNTKRIECSDPVLARRIKRAYAADSVPWRPIHHHLRAQLDRVEIDLEKAERIITTMQPDNPEKITLTDYRHTLNGHAARIANGDHWLTVDRYGRVHTAITSLARELRPCLSIDGKRLVGYDLANSQPLIVGIVARQYHASRSTAKRLCGRTYQLKGNPYHRRQPEPVGATLGDLKRYIDVCERGQLYESMMVPGDDRDQVKTAWLTMLYGRNHWKGRLSNRLTDEYPSIATLLREVKKKDYRKAAHLMQNIEATVFIGTIANRIMQERPELPVVTIHDSILTTADGLEHVRRTIEKVFAKMNVRPTLKQENYDDAD